MNWIKVSDKMPENVTAVLIWLENGAPAIGYLYGGKWHSGNGELKSKVTHWAEITEPK